MQRFGLAMTVLCLSGCSTMGNSSFEVFNESTADGSVHVGTDYTYGYALFYQPRTVEWRGSTLTVVGEYAYSNGAQELRHYEFDCAGKQWRTIALANSGSYADLRPSIEDWLPMTGATSTSIRAFFNSVCP
jgi:hypothetical protein